MKNILFIIFIFVYYSSISQKINGNVTDISGEKIQFANVFYTQVQDTSKIIDGTITDLEGNFSLKIKDSLPIELFITNIGYDTKKLRIDSFPKFIHIKLKKNNMKLDEVVIKGSSSKLNIQIDKNVYSISKSDIKSAVNSLSLVKVVPQLIVDETNKSITTVQREGVKVLVNGLNADIQILNSIAPSNIAKIEYYEIPPIRFQNSGYGAVINIITKENIVGKNIRFDAYQSPFVKFGNYFLSTRYNSKFSQFAFSYSFTYRNYIKKTFEEKQQYRIDNVLYKTNQTSHYFPFGYDMHVINLEYTYNKNNNYIINLKFSPQFTKSYNQPLYNFTKSIGSINTTGTGSSDYKHRELTPKLEVYFERNFLNKSQLIFDLNLQQFTAKSNYVLKETAYDGAITLNDFSIDKSEKKSIIAEMYYAKDVFGFRWENGIKQSFGRLTQETKNSFGINYNIFDRQGAYLYSGISGKIKKLSFQISAGYDWQIFNTNVERGGFKKGNLRTNFILMHPLTKKSNLKFKFQLTGNQPSLEQLNDVSYYIDQNFIHHGNPNLRPEQSFDYELGYIHSGKSIYGLIYQYSLTKRPIYSDYLEQNHLLISTYRQAKNKIYNILILYYVKKLLNNHLDFGTNMLLYNTFFKFDNGNTKNLNTFVLYARLSYYYKNFIFKTYYGNPYTKLSGYQITKTPVISDISIIYKAKNLSVGVGINLPFTKSYRTAYDTQMALYNSKSEVNIFENAKMFYLTLNYNFFSGKQIDIHKKISNSDEDKGIIKH